MAKNYDIPNLREIINDLRKSNEEEVNENLIIKLKEHINIVKSIGKYSFTNWRVNWRKLIYDLGESVKLKHHNQIILELKKLKNDCTIHEKEVIDFFISEIKINSITNSHKYFKKLTKKYPHNAEFYHTYGLKLFKIKGNSKKSLINFKIATELDKEYNLFRDDYFNNSIIRINNHIKKKQYQKSLELVIFLLKTGLFKSDPNFNNHLIALKDRIKDHIQIDNKIAEAQNDFKSIIESESLKYQGKTYEILSFFIAIIALIFTTINIGKNFKFEEALIFISSSGIILLIFVLFLSLMISSNEKFKKEKIIGILFLSVLLLFIISRFCLTIIL
ncbi:hypothetical protein [Tenacibaculum aiptasiae]|uniref:hypothetical protein n=1 Tax=Tenacibaculum aiptasiae TaxID=426481 RepID=UPI00232D7BDE|nr:hypothetical protein [Tenacibaculum aiptasiae]